MRAIFEHTADLGLKIESPTREEVYADAALGLFEIICGDLAQVRVTEQNTIRVTGSDPAYLLFDWLCELLYRFEAQRMLFACFDVRIDAQGLEAVAGGEHLDPSRHVLAHEVKAVTYHQLSVTPTSNGWSATVIVDI